VASPKVAGDITIKHHKLVFFNCTKRTQLALCNIKFIYSQVHYQQLIYLLENFEKFHHSASNQHNHTRGALNPSKCGYFSSNHHNHAKGRTMHPHDMRVMYLSPKEKDQK